MTQFSESETHALIAGLRLIQERLAAHRLPPSSQIGELLTKNGEYRFPTAGDLEPLIAQLTTDKATAPEELTDPLPTAIEAIVRIVLLHPTAAFTPEAITSHGYTNLARYADQMLADNAEEALISQEVMFVSASRPLTEEEHEAMYGDLPYHDPTEEKEER